MSQYIQPPKSEDCTWRVEPPPTVGWFPASTEFPPNPEMLRYHFGGGVWSYAALASASVQEVTMFGVEPREEVADVLWCEPWWPEVESTVIAK